LKVYNLLGQEVVTLFKGSLNAGRHYFVWEGVNESKIKMPSGIYVYQMSTSTGFKYSGKMVLLK
jgi:flagellar hook assembly protein FlgD